jgi:hypothetical protein
MITPIFVETMALYNKWQNENLFAICDELGDDQLHLSRGTTELHKIGIDYGNTDLPYNPYYEL